METTEPNCTPANVQIELERLNRLYAMLSHINRIIVRTEEPQELYSAACRIAIECGGFMLAWISLLEPGGQREMPVASAGIATVSQLATIEKMVSIEGPAVQANLNERPYITNNTASDQTPSWRSLTEQWGLRAGGSFPIRLEGNIIGAFNVAATEPDFFSDAELNLMIEVTDDISFALENIRREEKRIATESKMRYLVYYDSQTGMPSRTLLEERLSEYCNDPKTKVVVVLAANLRRYHGIVELLGHDVGQEIIRSIAAKLESGLPNLTLARVTESQFAALLTNPEGLDIAEELAWQMHRQLSGIIEVNGQELFLDPFIGISLFPQDGEPTDVLKHALQAASAKDSFNHYRFYFADMDEGSRRQLNLDTALHRALDREEFILHYQPQVDLASGRIVGTEALLRWQSHDYGLVSPEDFIPLLEDNGLIGAVGEWALTEACLTTRRWQDEGLSPIRMAVNLSARQFLDYDIRAMVSRVLERTHVDPQWLELELTESIVLQNAENVIRTMRDLSSDGVSLALDDFGTGYSSLSYLQRLPVTRIKIDRSFITNLTSNPSDAAIVRAVVGMAHSLGLSVIAEGVETEGQLGFLRGVGCEEIQGYLFSRPLTAEEFAALLLEGRSIPPGQLDQQERVILLVDDEPNVLSALTRTLKTDGYRIFATTSAREAFELLAMHKPGVVISDQRMPEITGTEFLRRVKALYPETVRIILSGFTELNSVIDAVNQGMIYKFMTKPWEDNALRENIKDAFNIYELHRENRELSRLLQTHQFNTVNGK